MRPAGAVSRYGCQRRAIAERTVFPVRNSTNSQDGCRRCDRNARSSRVAAPDDDRTRRENVDRDHGRFGSVRVSGPAGWPIRADGNKGGYVSGGAGQAPGDPARRIETTDDGTVDLPPIRLAAWRCDHRTDRRRCSQHARPSGGCYVPSPGPDRETVRASLRAAARLGAGKRSRRWLRRH